METMTRSRVLCVDDEPGIVRSLRWLLQKDFDVTTAQSGHEALPLVEGNDFDVVISDQRMPGMMGSEFLNEVRRKSPRSMRILLTGYSDMPAILRSINDSEIFRFVSKPWDVSELPKLVAQAAHIARNHAADVATASAGADTGGEEVLVIDDDPAVAELLGEALGPSGRIVHAKSLVEAAAAVREGNVGIVVADTYVGRRGTTGLLKLLKREDPGIVSIVYTAAADAVDVVSLINQGQIFRFLPKPVRPTTLKLALTAAILKRQQLKATPDIAGRHEVDALPEEARRELLASIAPAVHQAPGSTPITAPASLLDRIGGSFRRLFTH